METEAWLSGVLLGILVGLAIGVLCTNNSWEADAIRSGHAYYKTSVAGPILTWYNH